MNCDKTSDLDYQQTEEESLTCISDDALEAASGMSGRGVPTLFHSTWRRLVEDRRRPMFRNMDRFRHG